VYENIERHYSAAYVSAGSIGTFRLAEDLRRSGATLPCGGFGRAA
jgi:hypothetical protein